MELRQPGPEDRCERLLVEYACRCEVAELLEQPGQVRAAGYDGRVVVVVGLEGGRERLLVECARGRKVTQLLE